MSQLTQQRAEIRKQMRRQRRALSAPQLAHHSLAIADQLSRSRLFLNSQRIAGFIASDGEPSLEPLMHIAWRLRKHWYLPIIGLPSINRLWFAPYAENDDLVANRFGISEPAVHLCHTPKAQALDLILMPLVAFDPTGNRLGMGKGYYDRTLQFLHRRRHWCKPRLIGIAHDFQCVDALPFQDWDVPLDAIVTEQGIYPVRTQV